MADNDTHGRHPTHLRRFNKLFALEAQRLSTHDTRHIQPGDHPDSDKNQQDILPKEGDQQDHEEHEREGVENFQQTHHH